MSKKKIYFFFWGGEGSSSIPRIVIGSSEVAPSLPVQAPVSPLSVPILSDEEETPAPSIETPVIERTNWSETFLDTYHDIFG